MKIQEISGKTGLICLLGSPVSHSISPLMHNEAFRLRGLDYAYLCFDISEHEMEEAVSALKLLGARGFNCTMPDKIRMAELADELSDAARLIGAVNTVVIEDGRLIGHNTDGIGYMRSVKENGYDILGQKMTLLGAGGAATAIAVQAALDGVSEIALFNRKGRSWGRAEQLAAKLNQDTDCKVTLCDLEDADALAGQLKESVILTNATSVGMASHEDSSPIRDPRMLREDLIVSDVIYNPRETRLLAEARERGCRTFNGLYMLLYQGAAAFELWTGESFPLEEVKEKYFQ
ncbi:MAG: shikimate dehydrogenase [Eubacteriales bacterium]|nr:shikimate dehydrogenase [Eubacteriales bacterium]